MALTAGEKALYDYAVSQGQTTVSSVSVPPESLAKVNAELSARSPVTISGTTPSVSVGTGGSSVIGVNQGPVPGVTTPIQNQDIITRVSQIYTEMGNTPEANAQIAREANAAGLSAAQLSSALNVPEAEITRLASESGVPLNTYTGLTVGTGVDEAELTGPGLAQPAEPEPVDAEALDRIYREELGRPVGEEGIGYWLGTMYGGSGLQTEEELRAAIKNTKEGQAKTNIRQYFQDNPDASYQDIAGVMDQYGVNAQLLGEAIGRDPAEIDQIYREVTGGTAKTTAAFGAEASTDPEIRREVLKNQYLDLFGREPSEEGLQYWIEGEGKDAPLTSTVLLNAAAQEDLETYNQRVQSGETRPKYFNDPVLNQIANAYAQGNIGVVNQLVEENEYSLENLQSLMGFTDDMLQQIQEAGVVGFGTDTGEDTTTTTTTATDSKEAVSGSIVPGQPQVGEVGVMDYMGLQAGQPTLPAGTQLAPDLEQLEATDQTLQALTAEQKLATGADYVATPQEITASTVTSPTPTDAVTATATTTDLVDQPEAAKMTAEKSLEQINAEADALQAARQDLNEINPKATVQGQLALLQEQFADGEVPVWASGAFRQVNALMAQRGIGGSTIAAEAITNALMQSALPIAQQDASFYQNVTIQNLSNEQQAEMAKFNARTTAIFNDQAAENAARSLNTQSENELARFFAELSQNVALANTAQVNSMEQFNATAKNQMTQFFEELGLTAETFNADAINELAQFDAEQANTIAQFNASLDNQREQFNVQNQLAIDASNVQWRRDVNTQNTATTNAALQFDAQNLLNIQQTALNNIWQHYDTILNYAYQAEQNEIDRAYQLMLTTMSQEFQRSVQEDSDLMGLVSSGIKSAAIIASSKSGRDWVSDLLS